MRSITVLIPTACLIATFVLDATAQQVRLEQVYPNATVRITYDGPTPQIQIRRHFSNAVYETHSNGRIPQEAARITVRTVYPSRIKKPNSEYGIASKGDPTITASWIDVQGTSGTVAVPLPNVRMNSRPAWRRHMAFRPLYWPPSL
jgi:hypothetical protein